MIAAVIALALAIAHPAATPPKLVHFKSPSGNVNCLGQAAYAGSPAFVSCLVKASTWPSKRPKPSGCDVDWDPNRAAAMTLRRSRSQARTGQASHLIPRLSTG